MRATLCVLLLAGLPSMAAAIHPHQLRVEYRDNPLGIDVAAPRFSWLATPANAKARGLRQTAYRILVATSEHALRAGSGDLWDSGKVVSSGSAQIVYAGKPLASRAAAFWKVQVWDQRGKASEWSAPAEWSMGLLRPEDWQAKWIGLDDPEGSQSSDRRLPARYLRTEFTVGSAVRRAMVYYSGLGTSELYLNGAKVGDHVLSPGLTDYDKRALYVTFDVTRQVAAGKNAIGLILGNGRFYAPRAASTRNFGYPKAILRLDIEYQDGSSAAVVTGPEWKLSTHGPILANNEYDGEEYDARRELIGWDRPGFDDSAWAAAQAVAAPAGPLAAQMANPLRVVETLHPVSVKLLQPGVWIFDMGQNMVGWCRLHAAGPKGAQVKLRHAETLAADGSLYVANLRSARSTDIYTLKGEGAEVYEPRFTYHGFRYVELTGWPGPAAPTAAALEGRVVHDDMQPTPDFSSSSDMLNRIHHNVFWGIRGNYRSIPTDCPQRDERQGWLGDRSQVSRSESYMFDIAAFYSKWEQDIADAQRADGSIPDVAPNYWPLYNDDITWPSTFLFVPGMLYDQYGDRRVLERAYPAIKKWIEHERGYLKDGLMPKDMYADWCVPPEDPKLIHSKDPARVTNPTLIATAYYCHLLRLAARYARMLDQPADATGYDALAEQVNAAFQKRFLKPATGVYDNATQTSSVLPLFFNLAPAENRAALLASLVNNIEHVTNGHVGTGLVGAQFLMRTLTDNGRSDLAYEIATQPTYPGWGYMVSKGATTVWELWNGDTADPAMNSGNHVMQIGDLAVWMYEYLAGIRPDPANPGFRHILIHPYPAGDLTFVKASHQSLYGKIATSWKKDGGAFTLEVSIPPNTSATVWMPAKDAASVTESGRPVARARGVKFLRTEGDSALFEIESGDYVLKTK
ncbi:MAG: family 78 glycoside hydrolase catalytic domain [Bryobacteraceae bacterium]